MKKILLFCFSILMIVAMSAYVLVFTPYVSQRKPNDILFKTMENQIMIHQTNEWKPFTIKGINIGTGYPGYFPNEFGIDEETYKRWFSQIADMNVNTVRVYKEQSPAFYQALLSFNKTAKQPLYLLQGIDFSEKIMYSTHNILETDTYQTLSKSACDVVDILHGDFIHHDSQSNTLNAYTADVSQYVMGYILGIEWDEMFVEYTNRLNDRVEGFKGEYLQTKDQANGFEIFLAKWGNDLLAYEDRVYGEQKLISFCNWPLTDPFYNEFELKANPSGDVVQDSEAIIDLENVVTNAACQSGVFASYNVYPYYPYFLQYGEYTKGVDQTGKHNPYQAYLKALVAHHQMPVIITEYGAPASRSATYEEQWKKIHHGGLNEEQQAAALVSMYKDIKEAGCSGSIAFAWQDEWYKKAWNEKLMADPDERHMWSNAECSEQQFGVLAFEPGSKDSAFYPDGTYDEWKEEHVIFKENNVSLSMHSDERYIYLYLQDPSLKNKNKKTLAFDVHPELGTSSYDGQTYASNMDFVLDIQANKQVTLKVHHLYDTLVFSALGGYGEQSLYITERIEEKIKREIHTKDAFQIVSRAKGSIHDTLNLTWSVNPVGKFMHGNANPKASNYNSNADFFMDDEHVELRIPWQLLNFYDPSNRMIINDYHKTHYRIEPVQIDDIHLQYYDGNTLYQSVSYPLHSWKEIEFHERLKKSYYALQDLFKEDSLDANS